MKQDIVILDYGMANLRSVQKAMEHVGARPEISVDANRARLCDKLVVPGVGAFCDGIARVRTSGLGEVILDHVRRGKPLLGICLGMQFLFTHSEEDGHHAGLDLFRGRVIRFPKLAGLKVPHMGWNTLRFRGDCPLFRGLNDGDSAYFVHSYFVEPENRDLVAAEADYPGRFAAAIWRDNVFATQFHPEKSQSVGLRMLKNFVEF